MTLQQLRYLCAVDDAHSFAEAAAACGVTQPTLSAMVAKLEGELGGRLFDRRRKPVVATRLGGLVVARARRVLAEAAAIPQLVAESREALDGPLRVGILPTIAPYLLPLFIGAFTADHPEVDLTLHELTTEEIVARVREGALDIGVVATPYPGFGGLRAAPLFDEEFVAYTARAARGRYLLVEDIDPDELWVLAEGHCFGDQVLDLCALSRTSHPFTYATGSIDTLKRLVEAQGGVTVLPRLALHGLGPAELARVRPFAPPAPRRTVCLLTEHDYVRQRVVRVLAEAIAGAVTGVLNTAAPAPDVD